VDRIEDVHLEALQPNGIVSAGDGAFLSLL
jgi:hypothetical protein